MRSGLSAVINCDLTELAWTQGSLPIRDGGLGVRSVVLLAPSAFLASAAATLTLQSAILGKCVVRSDPDVALTLSRWMEMFYFIPVDETLSTKQRSWDAAAIGHCNAALDRGWSDPANTARLLAARDGLSGDWQRAYPISSCGLRVVNDIIRIAAGLRLGCILCKPHKCGCGAPVDGCGTHGLSCRRSAGRASRHSMVNDIIHRALTSCDTPSVREPDGMFRSDEKRPDGVTLVPSALGRCLAWDATVVDTLAVSHLPGTSVIAGSAAEAASAAKTRKYEGLTNTHIFVPEAFETLGTCLLGGCFTVCIYWHSFDQQVGRPQGNPISFSEALYCNSERYNAASVRATLGSIPDYTQKLCCSSCRPD